MPYTQLYYHLVWSTKNREPLILPSIETHLHKAIAAKAITLKGKVYAVGGIHDHIHLVVELPPTIAVQYFVAQVKGNTSHFVTHELKLPFQWQNEYGGSTFSKKHLRWVVRYVKNQREHHRDKINLTDELEAQPDEFIEPPIQ